MGKPTCANEFLRPFVDESKKLEEDGVVYSEQHYRVKIWGFTCDSPARSFITGTRGHTAQNACPKCKTNGVYYKNPGKVRGIETFPDIDAPLRTNEDFIDRTCPDLHAIETVVLEELDIDMVLDFPLDYKHLCCLGVMRKLLLHRFNRETVMLRITHDDVTELSRRLVHFQGSISSEFARRPRCLNDLPLWNATEFRLFFCILEIRSVLKGVLPSVLYDHFMLPHTAIKLLSSAETCFRFNSSSKDLIPLLTIQCYLVPTRMDHYFMGISLVLFASFAVFSSTNGIYLFATQIVMLSLTMKQMSEPL